MSRYRLTVETGDNVYAPRVGERETLLLYNCTITNVELILTDAERAEKYEKALREIGRLAATPSCNDPILGSNIVLDIICEAGVEITEGGV